MPRYMIERTFPEGLHIPIGSLAGASTIGPQRRRLRHLLVVEVRLDEPVAPVGRIREDIAGPQGGDPEAGRELDDHDVVKVAFVEDEPERAQ